MTSGRLPTPSHLRVLRGNPGKRPINKLEPRPRPKRPVCPAWLSPEAKKAFRAAVAELESMGVAYAADQNMLVVLATAVAHHETACRLIDQTGILIKGRDGGVVKSPAVQVVRDTAATITRTCDALGLNPSSRARLSLPTAPSQTELADRYLT